MTLGTIGGSIVILWSFLYTLSFAKWTWKKKNKLGAIMVCLIAAISVALPVYSVFFRNN